MLCDTKSEMLICGDKATIHMTLLVREGLQPCQALGERLLEEDIPIESSNIESRI